MLLAIALGLAGVAVIVAVNVVARRSGLPAAVLLVVVGLAYAWLPGPNVRLRPTFVLDVVIPPLLYAAALNSSAMALRRNVRVVASLSVGLVLTTAVTVGAALSAAVAGVGLSAGVALGAAVAPPDPVAALAIGRRAGLPPRLITLIEGEGLLNDAVALTLFEVAVASAVGGGFSFPLALGEFLLAAVGGVVAGLVVAATLAPLRRVIDDPLAENAVSLLTPFAAYLLAESFGGSGVLAVVVAGLWFAHHGPGLQSGRSRLQARAVWSLVEYLLEGFVFLLIGQQLRDVLAGLSAYPTGTVVAASVVTVAAVLLVRPAWLVLSERLPSRLHTRLGRGGRAGHGHLAVQDVVALSWSGTRGVITLAAAFSLPVATSGGRPFPGRDLLLFAAYLVVLVTLLGQGVTFAPLLRRLGYRGARAGQALLRNQARVAAVAAALDRLDRICADEEPPPEIVESLRRAANVRLQRYRGRLDRLSAGEEGMLPADDPYYVAARLRREMIDAERDELLQWRDTGRLPDTSLRMLLRELDHEEGVLPPG